MTNEELRREFERLPKIKKQVKNCHFREEENLYWSGYFNTSFLNGAWYAYQAHHDKISKT